MRMISLTVILLLSLPLISQGRGKSSKVIDFDDEVVEGVNKRPLDSVQQISDKNKKQLQPHLYRKRNSFKSETKRDYQELGRYQ